MEPTIKQYGIWGAEVIGGTSIGLGSDTHIRNTGVYQRIHALQASQQLPANTPSRIFIVFLKGFTYDFTDASGVHSNSNICGYHDTNNGTYYAVIPWEFVKGHGCTVQNVISHELQEAMTDPTPWNGWATTTGFGGFTHAEIGDACNAGQPVTAVLNAGAIGPGTSFSVQKIADNSTQTCSAWSRATTSTLTAVESPPGTMNVFWPVPPRIVTGGGALGHAWSTNGLPYQSEIIPTGAAVFFVGAPSAVSTELGRLDVYVQSATGDVWRFSQVNHNSSWSSKIIAFDSSVQPSVVTSQTDRTDMVVRTWEGTIGHYWSNDNVNYFFENLGIPQSIGPPILLALGSGYLNIFTYAAGGAVAIESYTAGVGWAPGGPANNGWLDSAQPPGNGGALVPVPFGAVYVGSQTQQPPFNQAVFVSKGDGSDNGNGDGTATLLYTPYITATNPQLPNNGGYWRGEEYTLLTPTPFPINITPFGAFATAQYPGDPSDGRFHQGVDLAWWDYNSRSYVLQHFTPSLGWNGVVTESSWDAPQSLGGVFINPPSLGEEASGYTEVFGVGTDQCLWVSTFLGAAPEVSPRSSPSPTGVCNVL